MADANEPLTTVLVVAEKRRMARDIAAKLSPRGEYRTVVKPMTNDGDRKLEVFTFESPFCDPVAGRSTRAIFKVTATHGHLYHSDFTDLAARIGSEASIDSADLAFNDTIGKYAPQQEAPEKETSPPRENQPRTDNRVTNSAIHDLLRDEARGCDYVILFLDCDLPGENICFQVIHVIKDIMKVPPGGDIMDRIFRAHYSTVNDIEQAMENLKKPNKNYSDAVEAKQTIDLRLGVAISRFITAHIRESLHQDFIVPFLHYGPCIAPILALIVQRFKDDRAHEAQKYWRITWTVERDGQPFELSTDVKQQPKEEDLRASYYPQIMAGLQKAEVVGATRWVSVEESEQQCRKPPKALNTVVMMAEASEQLNMRPKATMEMAQKLYEAGHTTYPRTEATDYPHNFDFSETAEAIIGKPLMDIIQSPTGSVADLHVLMEDILRCAERAEKRYSSAPAALDRFDRPCAHPPNVPTHTKHIGYPHERLEPLYHLITRHFLASISDELVYKEKTMKMDVDGWMSDVYTTTYTNVTAEGFTRYLPQGKPINHCEFEKAVEGDYTLTLPCKELNTKPPGLLTVSELVRKMGNYFLGTAGTIAEHIHKLVSDYEYVQIKDDHTLYPLRKGVKLVELLEHYAPRLASPEYRQEIHRQINEVAKGAKGKDEVVNDVISEVHVHYENMKKELRAADTTQFKDWRFRKRPREDDQSGEASSSGPAVKRCYAKMKRT